MSGPAPQRSRARGWPEWRVQCAAAFSAASASHALPSGPDQGDQRVNGRTVSRMSGRLPLPAYLVVAEPGGLGDAAICAEVVGPARAAVLGTCSCGALHLCKVGARSETDQARWKFSVGKERPGANSMQQQMCPMAIGLK